MNDFAAWLAREMPAGTVIADPLWWASRIRKALDAEIDEMRAERDALQVLLAECKPYVEYEREARERELMFAGGIASVVSRATHERDACGSLLARIDAAVGAER